MMRANNGQFGRTFKTRYIYYWESLRRKMRYPWRMLDKSKHGLVSSSEFMYIYGFYNSIIMVISELFTASSPDSAQASYGFLL